MADQIYPGFLRLDIPAQAPLTPDEIKASLAAARAKATQEGLRRALETLAEGRGETYESMFGGQDG